MRILFINKYSTKRKEDNMDNYIPDDTIKLTLSNDYAFKRIFSNEENKDILSSLLSVILKIPVKDIQDLQIENTLIGNTYIYEKQEY